jgi:HK97 gp10 family phage protein
MSIEVKVDIVNLPEFKEALLKVPKDIDNGIYQALQEVLGLILSRAQHTAPVDTGRLRADIKTRVKEKELQGEIYNEVEYAVYVHEGTSRMSGRPYLRDAITQNQNAVKERIQKRLDLIAARGLSK